MWRYILIFVKTGAALKVLEGMPYRDKSTLLALVTPSGMAGTDGVVQDPVNYFFGVLAPDEYYDMTMISVATGQSLD